MIIFLLVEQRVKSYLLRTVITDDRFDNDFGYIKFYNKKFENIIYGDIFEKLKTVDFDISKIDDLTLEEEEKELITTMKLQAEIDILNEERHYKDIFIGWFLREINFMRKIIEKKDRAYITLHRLKSELKIIHNINEIEEMYKEFNLIRRSDYV